MRDTLNISPTVYKKKTFSIPVGKLYMKIKKDEKFTFDMKYNEDFASTMSFSNVKEITKTDSLLLKLWSFLEMQQYLLYAYDVSVNPYVCLDYVKNFEHFLKLEDDHKILNVLDIYFYKTFKIDNISFSNIYLAIYEVKDFYKNCYRPVVELYTFEDDSFKKIGYGFDTNDDKNVEIKIDNLNYELILFSNKVCKFPNSKSSSRLAEDGYISQEKIKDIYSNFDFNDFCKKNALA